MKDSTELAWSFLIELRKEILEYQKARAQIVGFKITFVTTTSTLIVAAGHDRLSLAFLAIPAVAANCFDFLINSYSSSINRAGIYCRRYLEPKLRQATEWPDEEPLWEEFVRTPGIQKHFARISDLGLTLTVSIPALVVLLNSMPLRYSVPAAGALLLFVVYNVLTYFRVAGKFREWELPPRRAEDRELTD